MILINDFDQSSDLDKCEDDEDDDDEFHCLEKDSSTDTTKTK